MDNPHDAGRGVSVTIKHDGARDAPWIVFHGEVDNVREDIIKAFGFADAEGLTLHDLCVNAAAHAARIAQVAGTLGGTILSTGGIPTPPAEAPAVEQPTTTEAPSPVADPWAAAAEPAPPARDPLFEQVEAAQSVAEVQQVWAENQQAFADNAELMAAYKARGKYLSAPAT